MTIMLLAMTRFSGYVLILIGVVYAFESLYVLFGAWLTKDRCRIRLIWFLLLPISLFITLWFTGRWIWTIIWWVFVFGDAGPYEEYGRRTSVLVALVISAAALIRLTLGRFSWRYVRITSCGTAIIASLFVTVLTYEFTHRIYGWTARSAAENYLAKFRGDNSLFAAPGAARRVVEVSPARPEDDPKQVGSSRRFVLFYGDAPIQDARVVPYGWFWWTFASSMPVTPDNDMDWAVAHWETDPEKATARLNAVIRDYPNSDASRWASDTLQQLRERGSQGVTTWKSARLRRLHEEARKLRAKRARK